MGRFLATRRPPPCGAVFYDPTFRAGWRRSNVFSRIGSFTCLQTSPESVVKRLFASDMFSATRFLATRNSSARCNGDNPGWLLARRIKFFALRRRCCGVMRICRPHISCYERQILQIPTTTLARKSASASNLRRAAAALSNGWLAGPSSKGDRMWQLRRLRLGIFGPAASIRQEKMHWALVNSFSSLRVLLSR
jgi:hypothetical protein